MRGAVISGDTERSARVSLRLLVLIRWVAILGQAAALLIVGLGLGYPLPLGLGLSVVAASALFNVVAARRHASARVSDRDATFYLAYDSLQLGALLYLTGGLQNPFAMLALAPVTVAATILSRRSVIFLSVLAILMNSLLAVFHMPLPWHDGPLAMPPEYVFGVWTALTLSTGFIAAYAWSAAGGARRMRDAFAATQLALAREQRMSAVGALAAAVAHELGSPLATIAVVAKELVRELPPDSPFAEDAALLLSQSERCRTIMAELSRRPEAAGGEEYARVPVADLVEAAGEPYRTDDVRIIYATATDSGGGDRAAEPLMPRRPEILHGLGNLVQNAVQFAQREVTITTFWDGRMIGIDIVDDGLGFPPHLLARLGEPYLSGRAGETGHMGLGIFIAQTLLERTGARLAFDNLPEGGAHVTIQWEQDALAPIEGQRPERDAA